MLQPRYDDRKPRVRSNRGAEFNSIRRQKFGREANRTWSPNSFARNVLRTASNPCPLGASRMNSPTRRCNTVPTIILNSNQTCNRWRPRFLDLPLVSGMKNRFFLFSVQINNSLTLWIQFSFTNMVQTDSLIKVVIIIFLGDFFQFFDYKL